MSSANATEVANGNAALEIFMFAPRKWIGTGGESRDRYAIGKSN
jgi:hypothetical protein